MKYNYVTLAQNVLKMLQEESNPNTRMPSLNRKQVKNHTMWSFVQVHLALTNKNRKNLCYLVKIESLRRVKSNPGTWCNENTRGNSRRWIINGKHWFVIVVGKANAVDVWDNPNKPDARPQTSFSHTRKPFWKKWIVQLLGLYKHEIFSDEKFKITSHENT